MKNFDANYRSGNGEQSSRVTVIHFTDPVKGLSDIRAVVVDVDTGRIFDCGLSQLQAIPETLFD